MFLPYTRKHVDDVEEQVYEFMDRTLQYRIEMPEVCGLMTHKFSHIYVKYTFFKGPSTQTWPCAIRDGIATLQVRSRHVVVVNDAFVKYLAGSSLTIEVRIDSAIPCEKPVICCMTFPTDIRLSEQ